MHFFNTEFHSLSAVVFNDRLKRTFLSCHYICSKSFQNTALGLAVRLQHRSIIKQMQVQGPDILCGVSPVLNTDMSVTSTVTAAHITVSWDMTTCSMVAIFSSTWCLIRVYLEDAGSMLLRNAGDQTSSHRQAHP
jgi:hypothetical protein